MTLPLQELILLSIIALIIFGARRLPQAVSAIAGGAASFRTAVSTTTEAVPDARYLSGIPTGNVAELFGIGTEGIRWIQLLVLAVGIWLSNNVFWIEQIVGGDLVPPLRTFVSPAAFLFSGIVCIRSFQNGPAVALFTGVLYMLLSTAVRYADNFGLSSPDEYFFPAAILSGTWGILNMSAVQFAARGVKRWLRLAIAFALALAMQEYLSAGLFVGDWDLTQVLDLIDPDRAMTLYISALIRASSFWFAYRFFGRR